MRTQIRYVLPSISTARIFKAAAKAQGLESPCKERRNENMENYKAKKISLGGSDIAALTMTGFGDEGVYATMLKFAGNGEYFAYVVNEATLIPRIMFSKRPLPIGSRYSMTSALCIACAPTRSKYTAPVNTASL